MNANLYLVQNILRPCLKTVTLESHQGGTAAEVFILHDVFKVGTPVSIGLEYGIYHDLQTRLGSLYADIFPQVELRQRDSEKAILEMTWLGNFSMEEILFPLSQGEWAPVLAKWPDSPPIQEKLGLLNRVIERILIYLETIFSTTQTSALGLANSFADEVLSAIRVNLRRAQLLPELEPALHVIEQSRDRLSNGLAISCCHRDLMIGHIYVQSKDGEPVIRLADPKPFVPRFDETPEGQVRQPTSLGCSAVDLAHLEVSLYRRQLELRQVNATVELTSLAKVQACATDWIKRGRFSRSFYNLSLAAYFSGYASCRCKYCLDTQRQWLYDQMVSDCRHYINHCATVAKNENAT